MHPKLRALADKVGMPVSERSSYNSYLWDGKTLALNWQREVWDEDFLVLQRVEDPQPYDDFTLAHEIAHWVVADPVEREFPEYASFIGIDGRATGGLRWDNKKFGTSEWLQQASLQEGLLTREEQDFREACADFLGVHWCDQFGIPVAEEARPVVKYAKNPILCRVAWEAIIWLRERNMM